MHAREEELLRQELRLELLVDRVRAPRVALGERGVAGAREEVAVDAEAAPLELERVELVLEQRFLFAELAELGLSSGSSNGASL